ncbi:MAG: alpha-glucosidase [Clostridia bacterium]|nr:alpha-glucosidase [Clostridia bacterium]
MAKTRWYKDAVVYQIYPRSFCDSNGDGIGDIRGIISKLDYLKELGITCVWLSPCYKSPNDDNGYDISNYRDIMDEFGTLEDWQEMIDGMHARGIKLVMDLVVNHTSDEHEWFKQSRSSKDNPYRDYYIWRKGRGKDGKKPPNNWTSRFTGSAWTYDETTDEWYLHLFSKKQPDLNWDNPKVRQEVADICNYWFEKGVDGFRCDVITYISKEEGLPNGKWNPALKGDEHFTIGPNYHKYIHELNQRSWSKYDTMTVGEGQGITIDNAEEIVAEEREELDCVFTFEHQTQVDSFIVTVPKKFNLVKWKEIFSNWQKIPSNCQNSLYIENHDYSRSLPRYGKLEYRETVGKMLAISVYLLKGTPYIYQGQEIGMTNIDNFQPEDYKDQVSVKIYEICKKFGLGKIAIWALQRKARDHARAPMQWSDAKNAGFTTGDETWMMVNPNYVDINVEESEERPDSLLHFYQKLIKFRLGNEVIIKGSYKQYDAKNKKVWVYERALDNKKYVVVANYTDKQFSYTMPDELTKYEKCVVLLHNYEDGNNKIVKKMVLRPYEAIAYEIE